MSEPAARQRLREAREKATTEREAGATTPPLSDKRLTEIQRLREAMVLPVGMAVGWAIDELVAEVERQRYREKVLDRRNAETAQDCRDIEDENDRLMTELSAAKAGLERYRDLDAAAKELLARNVEFGTRADNAEAKCEDLEDEVKRVRNDNEALIESCRKWMNQATVDFDRARDAGIELERMRAYTGPTVKVEWGVQDATAPVDPLNAVVCDSREDARRDAERYEREVLTNDKPTPHRVVTRLAGAWLEYGAGDA